MKSSLLGIVYLTALASSLPHEQNNVKRQNGDYSELLELASLAGIPVPSDNPELLLSIAPLAASINSLLPTAPVLSVLETAAPSGLLSSLVHDPSFAASWVSSFEAGPSPSWFLALPTSIRSYLHTYADGGNLAAVATAAAGIESAESAVISQESSSSRAAASASAMNATTTSSESGMGMNSSTAGVTSGGQMTATSSISSSVSTAAAAKETGVLAAGAMAMVGLLGLAVAL